MRLAVDDRHATRRGTPVNAINPWAPDEIERVEKTIVMCGMRTPVVATTTRRLNLCIDSFACSYPHTSCVRSQA